MTLNGSYAMDPARFEEVYGPEERAAIERYLTIPGPNRPANHLPPDQLATAQVLVTGWGAPRLDADLLASAPRLELVLYGAGSVRDVVTADSWERGVRVTAAGSVIADCVAEFTLAQILFGLKHGWRYVLRSRSTRAPVPRRGEPGTEGSVVGLVSLGAAGRATARLLARHPVRVHAHDPHTDPAEAAALGVRLTGLDELFATSDVVSLHTPLLPETRGMVDGPLLESMKPDATLVNTARGGLIDEEALIAVAARRPDLFFALDVTDPEPPPAGSPFFSLENIVLTPHLAGNLGPERRRLGRAMAEELARYARGQRLRHEVTADRMEFAA
ncbi:MULTISPECIES: hydroxyacid dehydrogenase [unclassified Streptomyces]|uniref:hydroxyacid dehydrogenase n=1 Tax=unclassified Streptomyces TaxID=2593676 RepID=UPI003449E1C3